MADCICPKTCRPGVGSCPGASSEGAVATLSVADPGSAVPAVLFALVAFVDRSDVLEDAQRDVSDTADVFQAHARNVFETHELIARAVDARLGSMGWGEISSSQEIHDYLEKLGKRYPQASSLWLADSEGVVRNSSEAFPVLPVDLSDREFFKALRDQRVQSFVTDVVYSRISGETIFNFVWTRTGANGAFNGLIIVRVSRKYFTDFWRKAAPDSNMAGALFKRDLTLLARVPPLANATIPATNATLDLIGAGKNQSVRAVSELDGVDRLIAFRPIAPYDVFVAYGLDIDAALAPWRRHLEVYGTFFALSTVALFLASLLAVNRIGQSRIAARRALEEGKRRQAVEEQLRQAEKMEAIGQLTGQFAHDFGNILAAIMLNLEPARDRIDDPEIQVAVGSAIVAAEEGQKAVRSMLAFARHEQSQTEIIHLEPTFGHIEILVRQALGASSQLSVSIPPGAWAVTADPVQLELAILNLTVNARDAMPKGGWLRISAANRHFEDDASGMSGDYVSLKVSDTGVGIPPETVTRVFDPFFTTKAFGKGTGLGLSQVYSFAKSSGGLVKLDTALGLGTDVTIYLPRALEEKTLASAPSRAPAESAGIRSADGASRSAILLVEDEAAIRRAVAGILRAAGYGIIETTNGDEAIAALDAHPEIEMVFTDVRMPGSRDGIAMAAEARRLRPDLKILFATAHPEDARRRVKDAKILLKPYSSREALEAVQMELAASA